MSDKPKIRRRLRCPHCGSLENIKWGTREGVQRFKCNECGALFSARRKDISQSNRFSWFKKWLSGRMNLEEISAASGYSTRQLHRWFDEYLESSPSWSINTAQPIYLLIDGTYYSDDHCLIVYRAENLKRTLFYRFTTREDDDEIAADLFSIRSLGYDVIGITTDGGDNIIRAVQYIFPRVLHPSRLGLITHISWIHRGRPGRTLGRPLSMTGWRQFSIVLVHNRRLVIRD